MLPDLPPVDTDFRQPAVRASLAALQAAGYPANADPFHSGHSYCLPAPDIDPHFRTRLKLQVTGSMVFAFLLLIGAACTFSNPVGRLLGKDSPLQLILGGIGALGGFVALIAAVYGERRAARSAIRKRHPHLFAPGLPNPRIVRLENQATYNQLKAIADDFIVLIPHPVSQCVQLEGLLHRYLVYAHDLLAIELRRGGANEAVRLSYRAGGQPVDLMLIAYSPGLFSALQSALSQPVAPPVQPSRQG